MPLIDFTPSSRIVSADVDANFALCVLTDTARTITVTHTFTPAQVFTGGWSTTSGNCYIGDSANADMTLGLTINQAGNDNSILDFKSSDVAHGMTTLLETDTFGTVSKAGATTGGVRIRGFSSGTQGLGLQGFHVTDNTAKTASADAAIRMVAGLKTGTTSGDCGADANLVVIRNNGTSRFIFDAEGSAHADVEWAVFDDHRDLALLESVEDTMAPGRVQRFFGESMQYDRAFMEREGLVHDIREVAPGKMRGMVNWTRMAMLHSGAIRQVGGIAIRTENALRLLLANPRNRRRALAALEG